VLKRGESVDRKRLTKNELKNIVNRLRNGEDPSAIIDELVSKYGISRYSAARRVRHILKKLGMDSSSIQVEDEKEPVEQAEEKKEEKTEKAGTGRTTVEADALRLLKKEVAETIRPWIENEAYFSKLTSELGRRVVFHVVNSISSDTLNDIMKKTPEEAAAELAGIIARVLEKSGSFVEEVTRLEHALKLALAKLEVCMDKYEKCLKKEDEAERIALLAISQFNRTQLMRFTALVNAIIGHPPTISQQQQPAPAPKEEKQVVKVEVE